MQRHTVTVDAMPKGVLSAKPNPTLGALDLALVLYLSLPIAIFLGWFQPYIAFPLGVAALWAGTRWSWRFARRAGRSHRHETVASLVWPAVIALALTTISGVGHFVYANPDWLVRDAVLRDLVLNPWPPCYAHCIDDPLILRAPVAYYLPTALAMRYVGERWLDWGLFAWTMLGLALLIHGLATLIETRRERLVSLAVLILFGGCDLVGYWLVDGHWPSWDEHLEWWASFAQYSSHLTLLSWVPNHALPGWLGMLWILRHWRHQNLAKTCGWLMAVVPLWSPLSALGLLPFLFAGLSWRRDARVIANPLAQLPWWLLGLLIASFLTMDGSGIPSGWQFHDSGEFITFLASYLPFCCLEFGLLAWLIWRAGGMTPPARVAVGVLLVLPLYQLGAANDLVMRASIPSLMVLAMACPPVLLDFCQPQRLRIALVSVLLVGAVGALHEPFRALSRPVWQRSQDTLPQAVAAERHVQGAVPMPAHYVARLHQWSLAPLMLPPESPKATPRTSDQSGGIP